MKKLILVDLDLTLIPYDSFQKYFRYFMFSTPLRFWRFLYWGILRSLGFMTRKCFSENIILDSRKTKKYDAIMLEFAKQALQYLDNNVLEYVKSNIVAANNKHEHTDADQNACENVVITLCSASPIDYVRLIAEGLKWNFLCSYFNDNYEFIHLWGKAKYAEVKKRFPETDYSYTFAISDSTSDLDLLKQFNSYILYKKQI